MNKHKRRFLMTSLGLLATVASLQLSHETKADFTSATAYPTASYGGSSGGYSYGAFTSQVVIKQAAFVYHDPTDSPQERANETMWLGLAGVAPPPERKFIVLQWHYLPGKGDLPMRYLSAVTGDTALGTQFFTTSATQQLFNTDGATWSKIKTLTGSTDHINYHTGAAYGLASGGNNNQYALEVNPNILWFSGTYGPSIAGGTSGFGNGATYGQNSLGGGLLWKGGQILQNLIAEINTALPQPVAGSPTAAPTGQSLSKTVTDNANGQTTATEITSKSANDQIDYNLKFDYANAQSNTYNSTAVYHDSTKASYDITTTQQAFQSVTTITDTLPQGFVISSSNPVTFTTADGNNISVTANSAPSITSNLTYNGTTDYAYYQISGQKVTITYVSGDHTTNNQDPSHLNQATATIHGNLVPSQLPSSDPATPNANFNLTTGVGTLSNAATSTEVIQEFDRSASVSGTTSSAFVNTSNASWSAPKTSTGSKTSNTVKLDVQAHHVYGNYFKDQITYGNNTLSYSPTGNPLGAILQTDGTLASTFASHWIYPGLTVTFGVPSSQQVLKTVSPTYDVNIPGVIQTTNGASESFSNGTSTVISGGQHTVTDPTYIFVPGSNQQDIEWKSATPLAPSGATNNTMTGAGLTLGNWGYDSAKTQVYANFDAAGSRKIPISAVAGGAVLVSWGNGTYSPKTTASFAVNGVAGFYAANGFLGNPVNITMQLNTNGQLTLTSAIPAGSTAISLYGVSFTWTVGQAAVNQTVWKDNFPGGALSGSAFGSNYTIGWSVAHGTGTNQTSTETATVNGGWVAGSSPNVTAGGGGHLDSNYGNYSGWLYPNFSGTWVMWDIAADNVGNIHSNSDYTTTWAGNPTTVTPYSGYYLDPSPVRLTVSSNGNINVGSGADPNAPMVTVGGVGHVTQLLQSSNQRFNPGAQVSTQGGNYQMNYNFWSQSTTTVPGIAAVNPSAVATGGYVQATYNTGGSYQYQNGTDTWTGGTVTTTPGQTVIIPNSQQTTTKVLSPNAILNSSNYTSTWYHDVTDIAGIKHSFDHITNLQTGVDSPMTLANGTYTYTMPDYDAVISMYYGQKALLANVNHYTDNTNSNSALWNKNIDNNDLATALGISPTSVSVVDSVNDIYKAKKPAVETYLLYEGQDFVGNDNSGLSYTPMIQSISDGTSSNWKLLPGVNQGQNIDFPSGTSPKVIAGTYTTDQFTLQYKKGENAKAVKKDATLNVDATKMIIDTADSSKGLPFKLTLQGQAENMLVELLHDKPSGFSIGNYNYKVDVNDSDGKNVFTTTTSMASVTPDANGAFSQTLSGTLNTTGLGNGARIDYNVVITPLPAGKLPSINYYPPLATNPVVVSQGVSTNTTSGIFNTHAFTASHLTITNNNPVPANLSVIETTATPTLVTESHEYFGINFPTKKITALTGYGLNASYPYYYAYDTNVSTTNGTVAANTLKFNLTYPTGLNDDQSILPVGFDDFDVALDSSKTTTASLTSTLGSSQVANGFSATYSKAEMPQVALSTLSGKVYSYQSGSPAWTDASTIASGYTNGDHMIYLPMFVTKTPANYTLRLTSAASFGVNQFTVKINQPLAIVGSLHATLNSKTPAYDALWFQPINTRNPFNANGGGKLPNGITSSDVDWLKTNNTGSLNPWWK